MALELGALGKINFRTPPMPVQITVIVLPIIIVLVLTVFLVYMPKKKQMDNIKTQISDLDNKITKANALAVKLPEVEAAYKRMERELCELEKVVPAEYEVSSFLKQINQYSIERSLSVVNWKENPSRKHAMGIVNEMPVSLTMTGDYHKLGEFLADLTTFDRVVNIENMSFSVTVGKAGEQKLNASLTAVAYTSIQPVKCEEEEGGQSD